MEGKGVKIFNNDNSKQASKQQVSKEIKDILDEEQYIPVDQYLDYANKNIGKIKTNQLNLEFLSKNDHCVSLIDIQMTSKGPQEDRLFKKVTSYQKNMRRGNTILQIKSSDGHDPSVKEIPSFQWVRRGLNKFYDIKLEYINHQRLMITNQGDQNLKSYVMGPIFQAFKLNQNNHISLLRSEKANGENVQISYVKEFDLWAISSKNVCILANGEEEFKFYQDQRYDYTKQIAIQWFKLISEFDSEKVQVLKNDLNGYTLIGEQVGVEGYQHLIEYTHQYLKFYCMIKNDSDQLCQPIQFFEEFINKYGFRRVQFMNEGTYQDYDSLCDRLLVIYKELYESSIRDQGEGAVIYFVQNYEQNSERVISLGKLKTLEYRIFRKLREKLRHQVNDHFIQGQQSQLKNSEESKSKKQDKQEICIKEIREICTGYKLPFDIQVYLEIVNDSFQSLKINTKQHSYLNEQLQSKFIDFIKTIIKQNNLVLEQLSGIDIDSYFINDSIKEISQQQKLDIHQRPKQDNLIIQQNKNQQLIQQQKAQNNNQKNQQIKKPIYLGIAFDEENLKIINDYLVKSVDVAFECLKDTNSSISQIKLAFDSNKFDSINIKPIESTHLTTIFMKEVQQNYPKASFQEQIDLHDKGILIDADLIGVAIVPEKIITAVVRLNLNPTDNLQFHNHIPHLTLGVGSRQARWSNTLLKALIKGNYTNMGDLYWKLVNEVKDCDNPAKVEVQCVMVDNQEERVILVGGFEQKVKGFTKVFYS
ncbi:UNKNOWN [Stylonychia lemnae]|uniref:RNA ligase domain-containing protein n=1 Tax=Stylonychia lemnae TaxID=5949 RepID=A0A078APN9_STYLE|nr:UNKNOWN [Stylonychia lemnae]|eukprot:CDW83272.1 UNKNOWN [Stylonychia lemnae]